MAARTPEECDALFAQYVNARDLDALTALYEPGCSLVQRDGPVATGHRAIREVLGRLIAMKPALRVQIVKVVRAGDDHALVYDDWSMSAPAGDGPPIEIAGKAIEVVRRQADGTWRFLLDDPFARG